MEIRRTLADLGGATTIAAGTANLLLAVEGDTTAATARGVCLLDALTKAGGTLGLQRKKNIVQKIEFSKRPTKQQCEPKAGGTASNTTESRQHRIEETIADDKKNVLGYKRAGTQEACKN